MNDTDQYGPTAGTSGVRPARREPPQTLGGSAVATVLALAALFAATAAPALLAGMAIGAVDARRRPVSASHGSASV